MEVEVEVMVEVEMEMKVEVKGVELEVATERAGTNPRCRSPTPRKVCKLLLEI